MAAGAYAAICCPLLVGMAKTTDYLLTYEALFEEEAERIVLVSTCVEDNLRYSRPPPASPRTGCKGSKTRSAWTKYSLNYWYRMSWPAFETSLGLDCIGFSGSDVAEGLVAHRESAPRYLVPTPIPPEAIPVNIRRGSHQLKQHNTARLSRRVGRWGYRQAL
nr:hypothetical protein [Mycobacterium lepromatosis]